MANRASTPAGRHRASSKSPTKRSPARSRPSRGGRNGHRTAQRQRPRQGGSRKQPPRSNRPAARRPKGPRGQRLRWPKPSIRFLLIGVPLVAAAVAAGYFGWFRDSGLVAVDDVEIVGMKGPETAAVSAALTESAKEMTTLHLEEGRLADSVERFPTVAGLNADPNFPHGLRITVTTNPPVLIASAGGASVLVGGDGTLLHGVEVPEDGGFPTVELREMPKGRLAGEPLEQALVAGATPDPLRPLIEDLAYTEEHGVEVTLEGGIPVRFGTSARAEEKWDAAAAVLADKRLETLTYLDVRVPERPAVGGAAPQPPPEEEPSL